MASGAASAMVPAIASVFGGVQYVVFVKPDVLDSSDIEVVCDPTAHNASLATRGVNISNDAGGDYNGTQASPAHGKRRARQH